jgi:hypothetical protein
MFPEQKAIQVTGDEEDNDHYNFRLKQWMELGSHPNIHIAFASVKIFDGKVYPLTELIDTVTLRGKTKYKFSPKIGSTMGRAICTKITPLFQPRK